MAARAMKGSMMLSWSILVAARARVPSVLVACLMPWRGTLHKPVVVAGHSIVVAFGHWIVALSTCIGERRDSYEVVLEGVE